MRVGMPYVEFDVPPAPTEGIVRFYREILGGIAGVARMPRASMPGRWSVTATN